MLLNRRVVRRGGSAGADYFLWHEYSHLDNAGELDHARPGARAGATLVRYLGLIAVVGAVAVAVFWLAAPMIVRVSLGPAYELLAPQLWLAGLNQLIAALLYAYTLYLLVLRRAGRRCWRF